MAEFQDHVLGDQVVNNIGRMVSNMRDNAEGYRANRAGKSNADLAAEINGDMGEFLRRIGWIESLATRNLQALTNALAAKGLTVAQANSLKNTLKNAATALRDAGKANKTQIDSACDTFLAAIPTFERIF